MKYPDVEITEKVKGNIRRVEQEMNVIDPNLLSIADNADMISEQQAADPFDIQTGSQVTQPQEQVPLIIEQPVVASSRRWREHGLVRTVLTMWWLRLAYFLGASPARLWRIYYGG